MEMIMLTAKFNFPRAKDLREPIEGLLLFLVKKGESFLFPDFPFAFFFFYYNSFHILLVSKAFALG